MRLKKLILNNFQKHKYLELDFTQGVNVIHGQTDAGKSCIVRAFSWLYFGEPQGDVIRKEDTKKTSVKATLDNNVTVERIKSKTINAYVLTVPGSKPKRFDSIGRSIPEEVQKVLRTSTIKVDNEEIILNIGKQISLPFLLDQSGTFRNKLFNQLTGNDITDKALQSFNKDILYINKVEKLEKEHLEEGKNALNELTEEKEKVQTVYDKLSTSYKEIKEKSNTYEKLNDYLKKLGEITSEIETTNDNLKGIKIIEEDKLLDLEQSIERMGQLNEFSNQLKIIEKELSNTEAKLEVISPEINVNLSDLNQKIDKIDNLLKSKVRLVEIEKEDKGFKDKIIEVKKQIEEGDKKYKELLKEIKVCPFHKVPCPLNLKEVK